MKVLFFYPSARVADAAYEYLLNDYDRPLDVRFRPNTERGHIVTITQFSTRGDYEITEKVIEDIATQTHAIGHEIQ